jgi:hypothetical protein
MFGVLLILLNPALPGSQKRKPNESEPKRKEKQERNTIPQEATWVMAPI